MSPAIGLQQAAEKLLLDSLNVIDYKFITLKM
jgi:hypothetical protein